MEEGGRPAVVKSLAEHLACRRHQVTVLTAWLGRAGNETSTTRSGGLPHPDTGAQSPTSDATFPVKAIYLPSAARYRTLTVNPGVVLFCLRKLREFDVVHIYGTYDLLGPVVAAFCQRWNIPYVLEPLGMFRPIVRNVGLKRAYRRRLGWPVARGAARVIATSELERDELVADGVAGNKVVIRRNGLDLFEFDRLPPRGTFRCEIGLEDHVPLVLYLGRLSRKKGLDLLLEAFSRVKSPATLAIVGPNDGDGCVEDIQKSRDRLGLNGRVHLLGPRFGKKKLAAFADADVFVLPSRSENFGNAAAEAVACGVPVMVTDRCGIAPLVHDRVGLVVPCEVEDLRSALARLIGDQDLRDRLRAGAAEVRQGLSWDEPVDQMERLYVECIQAGRSLGPSGEGRAV